MTEDNIVLPEETEDIGGLPLPPEVAEWIQEEVYRKGLIYISWEWSDELHKWKVKDKVYKNQNEEIGGI